MIIIASKPGQLGNTLVVFANFIGFAEEHHVKVMNAAFDEYAFYFSSTSQDAFQRFPNAKTLMKENWIRKLLFQFFFLLARIIHRMKINNNFVRCIYLDWNDRMEIDAEENAKLLKSKFVFVQGWLFRSDALMKKHYQTIQNFFRPAEPYLGNIETVIATARKDCDVLIGIHIRHGDYNKFEGGKYFYTLEQYKSLMKSAMKLFPEKKVNFFVCTNSKEDLNVLHPMKFIGGNNHELEDMYSFAQCDYLLGPPSTYTIWASYYGKVPLYMVKDIDKSFSLKDFRISVHDPS